MRTKIAEYDNGNVHVIRFDDGTVIRYSEDDEFNFDFPENMDIKITNRCSGTNCAMCHEGSTFLGLHGDILNAEWIDSIHPFTEVALGGGNVLEHPDLLPFLKMLKERNIFANITLNQFHFMNHINYIKELIDRQLIRGLGVSLTDPSEDFIETIRLFPNAVIHIIAGVIDDITMSKLIGRGRDLKILVLGYKVLRRGEHYYDEHAQEIALNAHMIERYLPIMFNVFKVVSFDNLALEQVHVRNHIPKQTWDQFYQGEDGTMTFYIDMVENLFAKNSTAKFEDRYPIKGTVRSMFNFIKNT